jgi:hypothetical protein
LKYKKYKKTNNRGDWRWMEWDARDTPWVGYHFWMVENHYQDRVIRQFNLFQQIPPPAPIDYQQVLTYRKNKHTSRGGEEQIMNWVLYYWWANDEPELPITESLPTTLFNIMLTWCGIIKEKWLQYGTEWTLRNN